VTRGSVLRYVTEAESPKTTQKCAGSGRSGANLWRPPSAMVFRPTAQGSGTAPRNPCAPSGAGAFDCRASHGATADGTADRDACATRHGVVSVVVCSLGAAVVAEPASGAAHASPQNAVGPGVGSTGSGDFAAGGGSSSCCRHRRDTCRCRRVRQRAGGPLSSARPTRCPCPHTERRWTNRRWVVSFSIWVTWRAML